MADTVVGSILAILVLVDVGCDGVLGSGAGVDQCGICGGDGSACRVISGIFTRVRLPDYGYHDVTTIPTGACNVNITELARSRNFLALKTATGRDIVNGAHKLRASGHYKGAGTVFDYRRRSGLFCPGACIFADGPLTQPVQVQLLYYDRNPGIIYHYTVPQHTAAAVLRSANSSSSSSSRHHHQRHHHNRHHPRNHHRHHPDSRHRQQAQHHSRTTDQTKSVISRTPEQTRNFNDRTSEHTKNLNSRISQQTKSVSADPGQTAEQTKSFNPGPSQTASSKHARHHGRASNPVAAEEDITTASQRDSPHVSSRRGSSAEAFRSEDRRDNRAWHEQRETGRQRGGVLHQRHYQRQQQQQQQNHQQHQKYHKQKHHNPQHHRQQHPTQKHLQQHQPTTSDSQLLHPHRPESSQARAPYYIPPEHVSAKDKQAPIQYRHYYHVDTDPQAGKGPNYAALEATSSQTSSGGEALVRPNLIPATRKALRRWGGGSGGRQRVRSGNDVLDVPLSVGLKTAAAASGSYVWTISGFSECSEPCGGGFQQTLVVCMKTDTRVIVMSENCDVNSRPETTTVECNKQPCGPRWTTADWSECSVTCGHGVQQRTVECKRRISPTLQLSVSADHCTQRKPPVTQFCRQPPCFQWAVSNWTKCSTDCGLGEQTRTASCVNGQGLVVGVAQCREARPQTTKMCDMGSCQRGWYYTRWTKGCSPECGSKTYKTRKVYCAAEGGGSLPAERCPANQKPRSRKLCGEAAPCGGKWFAGPWSQCNATCGLAWRARDVVCVKKHGRHLWGVVGKENCLRKERPSGKEICTELPPCSPEWFMSHWSKCSESCDTGVKTREVKCLDQDLRASQSCSAKRPQERRSCNKHSCNQIPGDRRHRTHANDYETPEPRASPLRLRESVGANTSFRHGQNPDTGQPEGGQAAAPAEINLQQDIRSGGEVADERRPAHHNHRNEEPHRKHHASAGRSLDKGNNAPTEATPNDPNCTDSPNSRWCMIVSQARLCLYGHYKKQCCKTCRKYLLEH